MKGLIKIVKFLLAVLLVAFLGLGVFLLVTTLTRYKPDKVEPAFFYPAVEQSDCNAKDTLRLLAWNIGYAGLSSQMDFFYEGGTMVRPEKPVFWENIQIISGFISSLDSIDFILLQEVDVRAKRSWYYNQLEELVELMPDRNVSFAENYKVSYVPVPLKNPMGSVRSGLTSLSCLKPDTSFRYSLPASYSWPLSLFQLKRCFLLQHYSFDNGKKLTIINIHNSAYEDADDMRRQEMDMIKKLMIDEYEAGNYVIAGGDWNINPHGFEGVFTTNDPAYFVDNPIVQNFMSGGWNWTADHTIPTNRLVSTPYRKGETKASVIDFYLCSPNVEVLMVRNLNRSFVHSDHNPVFLKVVLN